MLAVTYAAFTLLCGACAGLQLLVHKRRTGAPQVGNNPHFLSFQRTYFIPYFPALLADWLQGPYLYRLYSHYGFDEAQIAVLYVSGFASSVLLGTWAPAAADRYGRKKLCLTFTLVYSLSCLFKLSRNYGVLLIARLLSGFATSLLFSAFEAWYVSEHTERHDFPTEWIAVTFDKAQVLNGVLAIVAGVMATMVAEWMSLGPVSPFLCAIPFLVMTGIYIAVAWEENYSTQPKTSFNKACSAALREIVTEPKIFLIGAIQSLFESVMYIFIFIWTPVLSPAHPPFGIVFSCFMVCIMVGTALYHILSSKDVPVTNILGFTIAFAFVATALAVLGTHPDNTAYRLAFFAFLVFEVAVGMYFPAMSYLSQRLIPDAYRRSISNFFRIPLNLIACAVLMMLHNATFRHGNRLIFVTCTALLGVAGLLVGKLIAFTKDDERVTRARYSEEQQQLVDEAQA